MEIINRWSWFLYQNWVLTLVLRTRVIFDPILHITVVDESNCPPRSINISTDRAEIFITNTAPRAVIHSTNLSSITSNVTELLSEHFQPCNISFENLMSKLSLVKISWEITFIWLGSEFFIENPCLEECPSHQSSTYNSGWVCLIYLCEVLVRECNWWLQPPIWM
jgi:hypothetical protein